LNDCHGSLTINPQTNNYALYPLSLWDAKHASECCLLTITGNALQLFSRLTDFYVGARYPFHVPFGAVGLLPKAEHSKIFVGELGVF